MNRIKCAVRARVGAGSSAHHSALPLRMASLGRVSVRAARGLLAGLAGGWALAAVLHGASPAEWGERAQLAGESGAFARAAADWQAALTGYRQAGDTNAEVSAAISLAGVYQQAGQQRQAVEILEAALGQAQATGDAVLRSRVQARLGAALVMTGGAPQHE